MVQVAWSTSNLKVYTARDGSATVCESCCALPYPLGENCGYCPLDETPKTFQVIISGVTDCDECLDMDLDDWWEYGLAVSMASLVNGTYVLTQSTNPCIWTSGGCDDKEGTIELWSGEDRDDCGEAGTGEVLTFAKYEVVLTRLETNFRLNFRGHWWRGYWDSAVIQSWSAIANECLGWVGTPERLWDCTGFTGAQGWRMGFTNGGSCTLTVV